MKKIPFYRREKNKKELKLLKEVLYSGILSQGENVEQLEKEFAEYTGYKYAVAVNSCTSAIHLSLAYLKPEEATIPGMTFVSVANTILNSGIDLKFEDKYYAGHAYPIKTKKGNIIDSAHEIKPVDEISTHFKNTLSVCYSFYPTKLISSAEGGMICTNNVEFAEWVKKARLHGMSREGYDYDYSVKFPGWKMNMTEIQAVLALEQLRNLAKIKRKIEKIKLHYDEKFGKLKASGSSQHLYIIKVKNRDDFINYMKANGVECSIHFKPIFLQPAYKEYNAKEYLPKTRDLYKEIVSLPYYSGLKLKEQHKITKLVLDWINPKEKTFKIDGGITTRRYGSSIPKTTSDKNIHKKI